MTHDVDLFKTQNVEQGRANGQNNVLLLVKFPDSGSTVSCGNTRFKTVSMRLTMESIQSTGSGMLMSLLTNEQHQRRAQKAAAPLPHGITHVLDLSPTDGEDDYILALTALSLPRGVKLWHRAAVGGVSIRATAGHDDVCSCMLPISGLLDYDHGYPPLEAPKALESPVDRHVCIFDTERWPVDRWGNVDDFCTTRWAANTIRLFRTIAEPAGQKSLLIDSAPRLWTLVGLFTKLEMTNFDILVCQPSIYFDLSVSIQANERNSVMTLLLGSMQTETAALSSSVQKRASASALPSKHLSSRSPPFAFSSTNAPSRLRVGSRLASPHGPYLVVVAPALLALTPRSLPCA